MKTKCALIVKACQHCLLLVPALWVIQPVYALDLLGVGSGGVNDIVAQYEAKAAGVQSNNLKSNAIINTNAAGLLPTMSDSNMFGSQLFRGAFAKSSGSNFNDSYVINVGDNIQLRLWGAYDYTGTLTVDPKGNIFIPNVGPLKVSGISNARLQSTVESSVRQVYRANVGVYASLESAQPVKVYVTGYVTQPGNYGGVASDSVLSYLDRAGGVDVNRGSYIDVQILRNGQMQRRVNVYDFLLAGQLEPFTFKDGDVIMVAPRKKSFTVSGNVFNAFEFEFDNSSLTVEKALKVARIKPDATHVSIIHKQGSVRSSQYIPILQASSLAVEDGDQLNVTSDTFNQTISVRIDGAHTGDHTVVLPYGATLADVLSQIKPSTMADMDAIQLYRGSIAKKQKESLDLSLDKLEEATLSVNSSTNEEAMLRSKDADLVARFVQKARSVKPKGQVVLSAESLDRVILEQGDNIVIPVKTSVIMVSGEVLMPRAFNYIQGAKVADYVTASGGFTQKSNRSKIVVLSANGQAQTVSNKYVVKQGEEVMVLPETSSKPIEVSRGLSQVLYQVAIAAKVVLGL